MIITFLFLFHFSIFHLNERHGEYFLRTLATLLVSYVLRTSEASDQPLQDVFEFALGYVFG